VLPANYDNLADARRVCRIVREWRGLSADEIAGQMDAAGSMFDRHTDGRLVRRLTTWVEAWYARCAVAEPSLLPEAMP
jgi:hypothetical protein